MKQLDRFLSVLARCEMILFHEEQVRLNEIDQLYKTLTLVKEEKNDHSNNTVHLETTTNNTEIKMKNGNMCHEMTKSTKSTEMKAQQKSTTTTYQTSVHGTGNLTSISSAFYHKGNNSRKKKSEFLLL